MKTKELEEFHNYLKEQIPGYLSMIINGSVAVGDVWVSGESDYDIILIFEDGFREYLHLIRKHLKLSSFTDEYLFVPFLKSDYTGTFNNAHDFSRRFRTKVLFGEDVTQIGELPSLEKSEEIYDIGLKTICRSLEYRLMSAEFWSEEKVKKTFHVYFKKTFMYLAIQEYVKTGDYPKTRRKMAEAVNEQSVTNVLYAIENRDTISKVKIIDTAEHLVEYLKNQTARDASV